MLQVNVDLGLFQETKATQAIYARELSGYLVMASKATSAHSGKIATFFCAVEYFSMEALRLHIVNVVSFQMASDRQWRYIVGCYLEPYGASTIDDFFTSIS